MRPLLAIILLLLAGVGYFALRPMLAGHKPGHGPEQNLDAVAQRQTISTSVELSGEVQPEIQVEVKPEISARVLKIHVKEGDVVHTGDLLIDLDATELNTERSAAETEIAIAQLQLESAQRDYRREAQLKESKLVTEQRYEDAGTAVQVAEKQLLRARQQLDNIDSKLSKTRILAPLDGTVLTLPVVEGQVVVGAGSVNAGTSLMTVADLQKLLINCHVNQIDVARLSKGMPFEFSVDSIEGVKMHGEVASIAPISTVKNNVKGFGVELRITDPHAGLRPGMTADVSIPTGTATNVLAVPVTAIFINAGKRVVYLKPTLGDPKEQPVETGITNTEFAEIKSGLKEGDRVLTVRPENLPK